MTNPQIPRIPTAREMVLASQYLRNTSGHTCWTCETGDCSTSANRYEASLVVGAFQRNETLNPANYWPMQEA